MTTIEHCASLVSKLRPSTRPLHRHLMMLLVSLCVIFAPLQLSMRHANAEVIIECDDVIDITKSWRRTQTETDIDSTLCYRFSGREVAREMARRRAPFLVELLATDGDFDLYLLPTAANSVPVVRPGDQINPELVSASDTPTTVPIYTVNDSSYILAVVPNPEGAIGSFRLRLKVGVPPVSTGTTRPPPTPPNPNSANATVFPTTFSSPCTISGVGLSNLCVDPYPVRRGSSAIVTWRISGFKSGEFDKGDGSGFIGPIFSEQRVELPALSDNRVVQLRWTDLTGKQYVDSIMVKVTESPVAQNQAPVNPNYFPCSSEGVGRSNLCMEQPYPVKRGTSAFALWRIISFKYGEFDKGDGRGFIGPISAEQRVEVPNVTGVRTIRLKWVDANDRENIDTFVIQVVD